MQTLKEDREQWDYLLERQKVTSVMMLQEMQAHKEKQGRIPDREERAVSSPCLRQGFSAAQF